METIIIRAKIILSNIFDVDLLHFERHDTRKQIVIDARRFLLFYLRKELEMKYVDILKHIPALKNHATLIHHYNKCKDLFEFEPSFKIKYLIFKNEVDNEEAMTIEDYIVKLKDDRSKINKLLIKYRKLL